METNHACFLRQLLFIIFFSQLFNSCGLFDDPTTTSVSCSNNCSSTVAIKPQTTTVGGKLAQSYVEGALIWADKLVNGRGNLKLDAEEPRTRSKADGDYQLSGITGDYQLVTFGGYKKNSSGTKIKAAPMLAPAPEAGQTITNITPLTTLVAFEPTLKEKLSAYGDWNADIASPSGVNGNLLRIAMTVETLSSAVSGGSSTLISNYDVHLKSLGKLATQFNSATGDLSNEEVLKKSASKALSTILSDSTLIQVMPTASEKADLISSLEKAVKGVANKIPDGLVVENSLLAEIETQMQPATGETKVQLGGVNVSFPGILTQIKMTWIQDFLVLTAVVPDDDPSRLNYNWSTTSSFSITDSDKPVARIANFSETDLQIRLSVTDTAFNNFTTNGACVWQGNPTTCYYNTPTGL